MREDAPTGWRLRAVGIALAICGFVVLLRLGQMQLVERDRYVAQARDTRQPWLSVVARRGDVLDANGWPLASTIRHETLIADPARVQDPAVAARALATVLGQPAGELERRLRTASSNGVELASGLTVDVADQIRRLGLAGLWMMVKRERVHPEGDLASQLLGVTGVESSGLSGIESLFESELAGRPGWVLAERDTSGDEIALAGREEAAPTPGRDVRLTIDRRVQRIVERELAAGVERAGAKGGTAIALDPRSGAVLAVASYPSFSYADPRLFAADRVSRFNLPAALSAESPGPIVAALTTAAALDAGTVRPDTEVVDTGALAYGGGLVRNDAGTPTGPASLTDGFRRSSNVVAAYVGTTLGGERLADYLAAFGFGRTTGSGLPGEIAAPVRWPRDYGWSEFDVATYSFGQGFAATPIQIATAFAALANDGTLMRPYVVAEVGSDPTGEGAKRYHPLIVRQVVKPASARSVREMLVAAAATTEDGRPGSAKVAGYRTAGLGGTSGRAASSDRAVAYYCGFAPADSPRFVLLVRIDEPTVSRKAETVAAPVFRAIAEQLLLYFRVPPTGDGN
jgi:cell division protein FtsI/penicillin-binding protein 2